MDREIPKEVRNKERNKKIIRYGGMGAAGIVVISVLISLMRTGVKEKDIVFSQVSTGTIEVSVSASGKVVPAFEEIINSPINTRILEVYKKGGDSVDIGTPILKLDLQSAETDYKQKLDEEQMRSYKLKQLKLENMTKLNDLEMKIKVSAMQLNRKKVELRNEQYLDSLGSGTTDKVRQAELSYNVAELEYEQLKQQYANEKEVLDAEYQVQELDFSIFRKTLAETKRTLDDAQVRSPRKAILTYINNQIGAQVAEGSQIAVISDLSHFKVEGEIADTYGDRSSRRRQGDSQDRQREAGRYGEQRHSVVQEWCYFLHRTVERGQQPPSALRPEDGRVCDERRERGCDAHSQRLLLRGSRGVRTVCTQFRQGDCETQSAVGRFQL